MNKTSLLYITHNASRSVPKLQYFQFINQYHKRASWYFRESWKRHSEKFFVSTRSRDATWLQCLKKKIQNANINTTICTFPHKQTVKGTTLTSQKVQIFESVLHPVLTSECVCVDVAIERQILLCLPTNFNDLLPDIYIPNEAITAKCYWANSLLIKLLTAAQCW